MLSIIFVLTKVVKFVKLRILLQCLLSKSWERQFVQWTRRGAGNLILRFASFLEYARNSSFSLAFPKRLSLAAALDYSSSVSPSLVQARTNATYGKSISSSKRSWYHGKSWSSPPPLNPWVTTTTLGDADASQTYEEDSAAAPLKKKFSRC